MKRVAKAVGASLVVATVLLSVAAKREWVDLYKWSIAGVEVTATAAELNTLDVSTPGSLPVSQLALASTCMIMGNTGGVGAATTPAAVRTNLSLVIGTDVQAYDADLTTWAGIAPSADAQALMPLSYAAMRTNLSLVVGTDVQAWDSDLDILVVNNGGSLTNLQAATALVGIVPAANGGAGASSGILKANGAGLVSAASSTTDYVAPITQVAGVSTSALVATVTFQSSIAGVQHLTGWLSEEAGGVAVGTNVTSIIGANSTVVLAGGGASTAYAVWTSKSDGLSTLTVTMTAAQDGLYFNTVQHNGVVVSTPAFNVAP
jgi:hypothetical protein